MHALLAWSKIEAACLRDVFVIRLFRNPFSRLVLHVIMVSTTGHAFNTFGYHFRLRAMGLAGLGYHFVIGNGVGMSDGEIHVGRRWLDQLPGAHGAGVRGDHYNRTSIGVCLVGNGDRRRFSDAQIQRLAQLTSSLARELGIPADRVLLHSDLSGARSPGAFFPEARFRELIALAP